MGRMPTGGFLMLDRRLLSDSDVRVTAEERRYLVDCRRWLIVSPNGKGWDLNANPNDYG